MQQTADFSHEIENIFKTDERIKNKYYPDSVVSDVLQASYDGLLIFDAYGDIIQSGGRVLKRLDEQCWIEIKKTYEDVLASGKTTTVLCQNKCSEKAFLVTASPVFRNMHEISHIVCNIRDVEDLNNLEREASYSTLRGKNSLPLIDSIAHKEALKDFVIRSNSMQSVLVSALRVAQVDSTILIMGESGVGKGMLARLIQQVGKRRNCPFVKVSCGAIPEQLLEAELFGYESGAFTGARKEGKPGLFEVAAKGTIFLDEVAELPLSLQVKLLNVLQDRTYMRVGGIKEMTTNARVVAATNQDLEKLVQEGTFRSDLFYRLHVIPIVIPPLRNRRGDILPLISQFLKVFNDRYGFNHVFSSKALDYLMKYDWPGNVRELQNLIEYMVVMVQNDVIDVENLPDKIVKSVQEKGSGNNSIEKVTLKDALEEYERDLIVRALLEHETLKEAADRLGIDISTLTRKKQKYGLIKKGFDELSRNYQSNNIEVFKSLS